MSLKRPVPSTNCGTLSNLDLMKTSNSWSRSSLQHVRQQMTLSYAKWMILFFFFVVKCFEKRDYRSIRNLGLPFPCSVDSFGAHLWYLSFSPQRCCHWRYEHDISPSLALQLSSGSQSQYYSNGDLTGEQTQGALFSAFQLQYLLIVAATVKAWKQPYVGKSHKLLYKDIKKVELRTDASSREWLTNCPRSTS